MRGSFRRPSQSSCVRRRRSVSVGGERGCELLDAVAVRARRRCSGRGRNRHRPPRRRGCRGSRARGSARASTRASCASATATLRPSSPRRRRSPRPGAGSALFRLARQSGSRCSPCSCRSPRRHQAPSSSLSARRGDRGTGPGCARVERIPVLSARIAVAASTFVGNRNDCVRELACSNAASTRPPSG